MADVQEKYNNRTIVIYNEAQKRGYSMEAVKYFGFLTNIFRLSLRNKFIFFQSLPLINVIDGDETKIDFGDKYAFKIFLKANDFPYIFGEVFSKILPAMEYGKTLGFPLAVKPRRGSLSRHTTININNEEKLREAIVVARRISREFIVEKFIEGENYRATFVDNKMVACALRKPLKVGDKVILVAGAKIHDATDIIHPQNVVLLEKISALLGARIIGFDIISVDISKPYYETSFAINEANSAPYIDMHHFPVSGKSRDVAAAIFDALENKKQWENVVFSH